MTELTPYLRTLWGRASDLDTFDESKEFVSYGDSVKCRQFVTPITLTTTDSDKSSDTYVGYNQGKKSKKRRSRRSSDKRRRNLLAYHQRMVAERGWPPSRLQQQLHHTPELFGQRPYSDLRGRRLEK